MRLSAALLVTLTLAGPAAAAAQWSEPVGVTEPGQTASGPLALTSADGTTGVFYRREGGGIPGGVCALVSRPPEAPAFGEPQRLTGGCAGAVTYARRSVAALTLRSTRGGDAYSVTPGNMRGRFGRATRVASGPRVRRAVLAANASGTLAVAWFEDRGTANDRVWLRVRPTGGRFGDPIAIAQDRVRSVAVAVGARGDVLVAWDARGRIRARMRRAGARSFTRTETIRSQDAHHAALQAAVTARGRAVLAWSAQFLSEGGDRGPKFTQVAVRAAGAARFRRAQLLERDERGSIDLGNARLAVSPAGEMTVAWTGHHGKRAVARVADADSAGVFAAPATISPATDDAYVTSAVSGPRGVTAVLWMRDFDTPSDVFAAYRAAGAPTFGSPELVSDGEDARFGSVTFDSTGRPTAAWDDTYGVGDDRVRRIFAATRTG